MKKLVLSMIALCAITAMSCQHINGQSKMMASASRPKAKPAADWKKVLTPDEFYIMVNSGTEPPYHNAFYENHDKGVYVSAATGDVLFTSDDKYDSGTGWPSFVKPAKPGIIEVRKDADGDRDEVIEKSTGLHLGHVFDDGPANRGGKRFCMNSGALKFIKK